MSHKLCLVRKVRLIIYGLVIIKECCHMPTTFYNCLNPKITVFMLLTPQWNYGCLFYNVDEAVGVSVCVHVDVRCIFVRQDSLLLFSFDGFYELLVELPVVEPAVH